MPVFESSGLVRDIILVLHFGVIFYTVLFAAVLMGDGRGTRNGLYSIFGLHGESSFWVCA